MIRRLLAYGGTSYGERVRVGNWAVVSGLLGAREGLLEGSSYGLGIRGTEPHLIFRVLQNVESRGGYPFTLLFDPGRDTWQAFGWNAPALLTALEREYDLFTVPENPAVDTKKLSPPKFVSGGLSKLHTLLAGSITSESTLVVRPEDIGFAQRPAPEDIAIALAFDPSASQDPCCCFTGLGWLVGGGRAVAEGLGARLAIDEESRTSAEAVSACEQAGRRLLADWKNIDRWDKNVLSRLAVQPPWEWERPPAEVAARIRLLAALLEPKVNDSVFADLMATWDDGGLLAGPLRDAARQAALSGEAALSVERTLYLLEDSIRCGTDLETRLISRMNETFLIDSLSSRYSSPNKIPPAISLTTKLVVGIWRKNLAHAATSERILRLQEAAEHLKALPDAADADYAALVLEALSESLDARQLSDLTVLHPHPKLGPLVKKTVSAVVKRTVRQRDYKQHAEAQFLWLDDEEVEQEVKGSENSVERASAIVSSWLGLLGRYPVDVERRLARLARSNLRLLLNSHVKQQVAEQTETTGKSGGPWRNYRRIHSLYHGGETSDASPIDDQEKWMLQEELDELFHYEDPTATPNLSGLVRLLAPLLQGTVNLIRRKERQPDPLAPGFDRWQEGLELLGLYETRSNNILEQQRHSRKVSRTSDEQNRDRQAVKNLDSEFLQGKLRQWLLAPVVDASELEKLDLYIGGDDPSGQITTLIEQVLRNAEPTELRSFADRFRESNRIERLFELLPDEMHREVVGWLADDRQEFRRRYQERILAAIRKVKEWRGRLEIIADSHRCAALDEALANYLLNDLDELESWATTLMGDNPEAFLKYLIEIQHLRLPKTNTPKP